MRTTVLLLLTIMLVACNATPTETAQTQEAPMTLSLSSTAFASGQPIPSEYSCNGKNISPPLAWSGVPAGVKSFALILEDPDAPAGTFIHWVIYNIPANATGLQAALPEDAQLPDGSLQGNNSGNRQSYDGPCPPSGTHHYVFRLYALDTKVTLPAGVTKDQLLKAMQGHILAQGELMGTFAK